MTHLQVNKAISRRALIGAIVIGIGAGLKGCAANSALEHSQLVAQIEHDQRAKLFSACTPDDRSHRETHGSCARMKRP